MKYFALIISFLLLPIASVFSVSDELGSFPYRNFLYNEYHGHFQNWAIVQDHRGIIYVANNNGILEYDGRNWSLIPVNNAVCRSLDVDASGRVWVGALNEMGYLAPDSEGAMSFHSVLHVADQEEPIGLVRQVFATKNGIYFCTNGCIIRIKGNQLRKWYPKTFFHRTYCVADTILSFQPDVGLTAMQGDTMVLVKGAERLETTRIYTILPYDATRILIGTQSEGLYLLEVKTNCEGSSAGKNLLVPFQTSNDPFFKENWIYNGLRLPNGWYAIATYRGGAVVFNEKGQVLQYIGKEQGMQDETVWNIACDSQDNIWLALNNGISYSALISPITKWDSNSGLQGVLQSVNRYQGVLYVSSNTGVYYLERKNFHKIDGIFNLSWNISVVKSADGKETAFVATGDGVYQLENKKAKKVNNAPAYLVYQSKYHKNTLFIGLYEGIGVMSYKAGKWHYLGRIEGIDEMVHCLTEDDEGNLWHTAYNSYIVRVAISHPTELKYDSREEFVQLPYSAMPNSETKLINLNGHIKLTTDKGLAFYNADTKRFEPDSSLGTEFTTGNTGITIFNLDSFYNLWFESLKEPYTQSIERAVFNPEGFFIRLTSELNEIPNSNFYDVHTDNDGVSWITSADGLYRFDPNVDKKGRKIPSVVIRKVIDAQKHTIFKGAFPRFCGDEFFLCTGTEQQVRDIPAIPYTSNSLTFTFTSPFFGQEAKMLYSYMLEGYENDWSEWTTSNTKDYTNLPHGKYRFLVKALSAYEVESNVAAFSFSIRRPWFHHPLIYVLYIVICASIIYLIVFLNAKRLTAINRRLHKLVEKRTQEILLKQQDIIEKNAMLEKQKERILAQNEELMYVNMQTNASIQYALTIQQAILPEKKTLDLYFEHFVIYRPRDVVSGDFYWFSYIPPRNNMAAKKVFAIADCTGHGVPGAFMSMIGSRMLSEIVNERGVTDPSQILHELNIMLNLVLHQESTENFDGMDVALCTIEITSNNRHKVLFAGANRHVYYFKNGTDSIEVIRGNRKYIGGFLPDIDQDFQTQTFELDTGDSLFFCTDGLTDQNNTEKKKFSVSRFLTILKANINEPMASIGKAIENEFDTFKGDVRQRDDITVVGLRLK